MIVMRASQKQRLLAVAVLGPLINFSLMVSGLFISMIAIVHNVAIWQHYAIKTYFPQCGTLLPFGNPEISP